MTDRTVSELWTWWAPVYLPQLENRATIASRWRLYLLPKLGDATPCTLVPSRIEAVLNELALELAPATLNGIRSHLARVINDAIGERLWPQWNPVDHVRVRPVPIRAWPTLTAPEGLALLAHARELEQSLYAIALYLGPRKGELYGAHNDDVDRDQRLLTVTRSHHRDTTKNAKARVLPITAELWPYVEAQLERSRRQGSEFLFPALHGQRRYRFDKLAVRLRAALKRAGVVVGFAAICRWCSFRCEVTARVEKFECPKCRRLLWLEPQAKPLRFHDLRHTFATLAGIAGIDREIKRYVLGHTGDVTTLYEHGGPEPVRRELAKLTLGSGGIK